MAMSRDIRIGSTGQSESVDKDVIAASRTDLFVYGSLQRDLHHHGHRRGTSLWRLGLHADVQLWLEHGPRSAQRALRPLGWPWSGGSPEKLAVGKALIRAGSGFGVHVAGRPGRSRELVPYERETVAVTTIAGECPEVLTYVPVPQAPGARSRRPRS